MLTFQFSLMFLIASQGSRLMYSTGDPMVDGSTSEALQIVYCTVYCTWRHPWLMGDVLHSVLYMATPHRSYLYIR
jgi:hypothetical protein